MSVRTSRPSRSALEPEPGVPDARIVAARLLETFDVVAEHGTPRAVHRG